VLSLDVVPFVALAYHDPFALLKPGSFKCHIFQWHNVMAVAFASCIPDPLGPSRASEEYQSFRDGFSRFLSGAPVTYEPNVLVTSLTSDPPPYRSGRSTGDVLPQSIVDNSKNIALGQRLPSHKVICQCESTVVHLANALPSTGKWRILVFAGDLRSTEQRNIAYNLDETLQSL
jgi:hypothetical protein